MPSVEKRQRSRTSPNSIGSETALPLNSLKHTKTSDAQIRLTKALERPSKYIAVWTIYIDSVIKITKITVSALTGLTFNGI